MLMNICWFNCMGVDDATGKFDLQDGRLRLRWTQRIADNPTFHKAETILRGIATAMKGKYQPFPLMGRAPAVRLAETGRHAPARRLPDR